MTTEEARIWIRSVHQSRVLRKQPHSTGRVLIRTTGSNGSRTGEFSEASEVGGDSVSTGPVTCVCETGQLVQGET